MDEQALTNLIIRHSLATEGLSRSLARKIVRLLNSADEDLLGTLAARYALIEKKGIDPGPATTKRLEDLLKGLREINTEVYKKIEKGAIVELAENAKHEAEFTAGAASKAGVVIPQTALPSAQFLETLVTTTPIPVDVNGAALLKPWVASMETGRLGRLEAALRLGILQGETTDSLVKRIKGDPKLGYKNGILDVSRRSAQTFALTANASVQNAARLETFRAMKTINFVEWSSVLDDHTTPICQGRSGNIYAIDKPHPTAPAHPRCRSLLLPRRNDTDPPKHKPFSEWLQEQPAKVQNQILGNERAEVFRNGGKQDFQKFFREDGSYRTLAELRRFDASLFADK